MAYQLLADGRGEEEAKAANRAAWNYAVNQLKRPSAQFRVAEATPTTRLVYAYIEPYNKVKVTVRQLEELLGISHRPAFEALRDLRKLGLVSLSHNARGRPRGVSRRRPDAR